MKVSIPISNDELPKNLKYIIMIFQKGKKIEEGIPKKLPKILRYMQYEHPNFIGFSGGGHGTILNQFFTGSEKKQPFGRTVQLPKIFNTKKEAVEMIKVHKKADKGFNQKHIYNIVPIDIGVKVLTREQEETVIRIIRRMYLSIDKKRIKDFNTDQLLITCGRLQSEITWLIYALMINREI